MDQNAGQDLGITLPKIRQGGNGDTGFYPYADRHGPLVRMSEQSDYALSFLIDGDEEFTANQQWTTYAIRQAAAQEWLRRYPAGEQSRTGTKGWAIRAEIRAWQLLKKEMP